MAKKGCEISWTDDDSFKLTGSLDEYTDLSSLALHAGKTLRIDLSEVGRVNSTGVRTWIQTMIRHRIKLILTDCSPTVVEQFSMISEFIGEGGYVESFYALFICDACEREESQYFQLGKDVQAGELPELAEKVCPDCGELMECEHNEETYFSFLKNLKVPKKHAS